jgi:protein O-GlcNAc transferase
MDNLSIELAWQLHRGGDHEGAEKIYAEILRREPRSFPAWLRLGLLYGERGDYSKAERYMANAIGIDPSSADAHFLRGSALMNLGRDVEASECFAKGTAIAPNMSKLWLNRAVALLAIGRSEEALTCIERCLVLAPEDWNALVTRGTVLMSLGRGEEAKKSFDAALAINPNSIDALVNRATIVGSMRRYEDAVRDCERVLTLDPSYDYMPGFLMFFRLSCCDWRNFEEQKAVIAEGLKAGRRVIQPLMNLSVSEKPADQLRCARIWAQGECAVSSPPLWNGEIYRHRRIRVGYISEDFREHPVGRLIGPVLERHDRRRFEIAAYSLGPGDKSEERDRIVKACDSFVDPSDADDRKIAETIRKSEIDIAVDLMGYSGNGRRKILGFRPAPVQVSFMGYAGTTGAGWVDYLIADPIAVPKSDHAYYSEKIAYLPGSYLPAELPSVANSGSRKEAGLPDKGFVFCSFNNAYKITPRVFSIWMRLLSEVEGSVLWLGQVGQAAQVNLLREASTRGVAPERLIFAPYIKSHRDHLARLQVADLFLDTLPHNAHSTAIDALQAGVPVLTSKGAGFAGRVGASLVSAAGVPELVTLTLQEYEERALAFAREPDRLRSIRDRLARTRETSLLFDTTRFVRNLEAAFTAMHARAGEGLPPVPISVPLV